MKLYSGPLSLFTAKVRIALREKRIEFERIEVPFTAADVACMLVILFASRLGAPPPAELEHLAAWLARCAARPAVAEEIDDITGYAAKLSG